jgi:membrane associated rhomboid family serine protease
MKALSFPPLTRVCILVFVTLSGICLGLRYAALVRMHELSGAPGEETIEGSDAVEKPLPQFREMFVPYMTLVPGLSITYPWVVLTSSFIEQSLLAFLTTGLTLAYAGKYCERVWGCNQLAIFLGIQSIVPNIVTLTLLYILYVVTLNESFLNAVVSGGLAIQMGYLVAFKQLVPEHSIILFHGVLKTKVKYLTMPVLLFYTVVGLATRDVTVVSLAWVGFFTSWIYLRFYKISYVDTILPMSTSLAASETEQVRIRGDASDTFSLAHFFYPAALRELILAMSGPVFSLLVAVKVCSPFNEDDVEAGNFRASMRDTNKNNAVQDEETADRRRALALKVLEERLQK